MRILPALALLGWAASAVAAPQQFSSGPSQVTLLELYSSEGCSSCPPAEDWLSQRINDPSLWKTFIPVEFHVNYWNSLGWTDRLSTRAFTAREYGYAEAWGKPDHVYTPCFVMNGAEYRPDRDERPASMVPAGTLSLEVEPDGSCRVEYHPLPESRGEKFDVQVALLGSGLSARPDAGENRGVTLHHEFVVIGLDRARLSPAPDPGLVTAQMHLPAPIVAGAARRAVAVWVTRHDSLQPVQATGGWLL